MLRWLDDNDGDGEEEEEYGIMMLHAAGFNRHVRGVKKKVTKFFFQVREAKSSHQKLAASLYTVVEHEYSKSQKNRLTALDGLRFLRN